MASADAVGQWSSSSVWASSSGPVAGASSAICVVPLRIASDVAQSSGYQDTYDGGVQEMLQRPQLPHRKSLDLMVHSSRRELWMPNPIARRIVGKLVAAATVALTYLSLGVYLDVTHIMRMKDGTLGQMTICISPGFIQLSLVGSLSGRRKASHSIFYHPHAFPHK